MTRHPQPPQATLDRARTPRGLRPPTPIPATNSTGPVSAEALAALLGIATEGSNTYVTERNVTGLVAVQAGVDMIAHAVATMMCAAEVTLNGLTIDTPSIVARPHPLLTSYEFWVQAADCAMKRGNYVGVLADFDAAGYARQAIPAHPDAVNVDDSTGFPIYRIGATTFRYDEVVHVRHGAPVGSFWGLGIVERYRLALNRHLHEAEWGRSSFASGGVPSAVISLDKDLVDNTEAEQVQDRWLERNIGARKPAVIGRLMKIEPISWTPEDAEFCEARRLSIGEAALMCGLDPSDLGAHIGGGGMQYENITDRQLGRVLQSYEPWMTLFEQAWSDLTPGRASVLGTVEALLRSSTKERFEAYAIGHKLGIYTTPELRVLERRPEQEVVLPTPEVETEGDPQ